MSQCQKTRGLVLNNQYCYQENVGQEVRRSRLKSQVKKTRCLVLNMTNIQYCYQDVNNAVAKSLVKGPVDIGFASQYSRERMLVKRSEGQG